MKSPPTHKFTVFSIVNDDDFVIPKFAQCNNCGVIHKVHDFCKSEILAGKEFMSSIMSIDDIKLSLPADLQKLLDMNKVDLSTYEAARFIVENKRWGEFVVLSSDAEEGMKQGKYVSIFSETLYKVETFVRSEIVK